MKAIARLVYGVEATQGGCLPVRWVYDPADPWAVTGVFGPGEIDEQTWTFSRELLHEGMVRPAGLGDVRIYPTCDNRRLTMILDSPDGLFVADLPKPPIVEWLKRTYDAVPSGREHRHQYLPGTAAEITRGRS